MRKQWDFTREFALDKKSPVAMNCYSIIMLY